MKIIHPDSIEYDFMFRALCQDRSISSLDFNCESYECFDEGMDGDIIYIPAPLAIKRLSNYSLLSSGNIFSHFSGPSIMLTVKEFDNVYVKEGDYVSLYYGKILSKRFNIVVGTGEPRIVEPARILEIYNPRTEKIDLYEEWGKRSNFLPMPLYLGILKNSYIDIKGQIERLIYASIKKSLDNFNYVVDEIYRERKIDSPNIVKMVVLQFVNKRSMSIGEEEEEAIKLLSRLMTEEGLLP